jgi:hypothetical protein
MLEAHGLACCRADAAEVGVAFDAAMHRRLDAPTLATIPRVAYDLHRPTYPVGHTRHAEMTTHEKSLSAAGERRWRPHEIIEDPDLSLADKTRLLESLELDLRQLQRATEENMPGAGGEAADIADRLSQVRTLLSLLRTQA